MRYQERGPNSLPTYAANAMMLRDAALETTPYLARNDLFPCDVISKLIKCSRKGSRGDTWPDRSSRTSCSYCSFRKLVAASVAARTQLPVDRLEPLRHALAGLFRPATLISTHIKSR